MMSALTTLRPNPGRRFLAVVAITMMIVLPVPAASQAVIVNADYPGGILHATAARPSFEVASIRQSPPNALSRCCTIQRDGIEIRGTSIKDVIEFAYAVPNEKEFSGGPSWIRTEKFDITAKPSEAEALGLSKLSPKDLNIQMRLMLQSLLEERFRLKVSFAMKNLPLFALVEAKGGFKCTNVAADGAPEGAVGPPPPPPKPAPGHEPWREQPMHWALHRLPFYLIVTEIAYQPELGGRIVVDKTDLNGVFDCKLSWAHEGTDVPGPSFFTALQEQMGLQLRPEHGPVETIVVDRVEMPSAN